MVREHHRRSIRLRAFDYAKPGSYFITVCSFERTLLFGEIVGQEMHLNDAGLTVSDEWTKTSILRPDVEIDTFVVMPNHMHGILTLHPTGAVLTDTGRAGTACRGTARRAPTERFGIPVAGSIPTIVRAFKSAATKRINILRSTPNGQVWQRGYYEHVIRNEEELNRARQYILNNPLQWEIDHENHAFAKNLVGVVHGS